jgi:hypothetical protein
LSDRAPDRQILAREHDDVLARVARAADPNPLRVDRRLTTQPADGIAITVAMHARRRRLPRFSVAGAETGDEPMMRWPMGEQADLVDCFCRCFAYFLEEVLGLGLVWEAGDGKGAAVWVPPERRSGHRGTYSFSAAAGRVGKPAMRSSRSTGAHACETFIDGHRAR